MKRRGKPKNFTLTPLRVKALEFIAEHPKCFVGYVAENVLAQKNNLWSQAATRMGAGYCKQLQDQGLVLINTYVDYGYGRVEITEAGRRAVAERRVAERQASENLDAVIGRCIE